MTLNKFDVDVWEHIFGEISFVSFVTKKDVMCNKVKIAEINNDNFILFINQHLISKHFSTNKLNELKRHLGISYTSKNNEIHDMVCIVCDELGLVFRFFNEMGLELNNLGISDYENIGNKLHYRYKKYGTMFDFEGFDFKVITKDNFFNEYKGE